jgi:hypothetical protein
MTDWQEPMPTRENRLLSEAADTGHGDARGNGWARTGGCRMVHTKAAKVLAALSVLTLSVVALRAQTVPTYQIQSVSPESVPAGAAGATIALSGTLPDFTQGTYQVCFYTGSGSNAALTPSVVQGGNAIAVPASTIQSIPASSFTAANGYAVPASAYVVLAGGSCNGTTDPTLSNTVTVPVIEPTLGAYTGPTGVPQTNSLTNVQAPPTAITLAGNNFVAATTVTFGTLGTITPKLLTPSSISVAVPAAFSSSPVGTTATLTVCNSVAGGTSFCSTPALPITLTVVALTSSSGTITATPTPVTTSGQTVLTAQFAQSAGAGQPSAIAGAPSGTVAFTADGTTLAAANLVLDKTATFTAQTTVVTTSTTATPTITPAAGSYVNSVTITMADSTPGATIYYTQDGTTPTTSSTAYAGSFNITASQTIQAIALAPGYLTSAAASAAYVITISPPTQLAFLVQPSNTATATAITPVVQVAIQDAQGNTVTSANNPVTIAIANNPGDATLGGTTTVNAVNGVAAFSNLSITPIANGYTLTATSGTLTAATSVAFNVTPYPITMTVQSALIGIGSTLSGSFTLTQPAPQGGVVVTLASSAPAVATIAPATVPVAAGQTTGAFTYTGVTAGNSNLTASATNYLTGTVQVTSTAAQVSLGMIPPVAPGQMQSLALSLPSPAPPGGTTVTFTSSNPAIATVTASVFVPAGQQTPAANPQVTGLVIGTSTITAFAPGFAPATRVANVTVTATFNPGTTNINLTTSTNTTLNISAPAPAGGITFTLSSDNPAVATVPASVTVVQGGTSVPVAITGIGAGSTTIRADSAGITEATGTVNVASAIGVGAVTTGINLENNTYISLPVSPPTPITVTVTSSGPAIATISKTGTVVGGTTLTFTNVTSSNVGYVYIQGQTVGATTLTVSAPGFTTGSGTITVLPSGFTLYYDSNFSTTTYAAPTTVNLYTTSLTPGTLTVSQVGLPLNPGLAPISVPITSSDTAVGTITTNPVIFHAGDSSDPTTFQPVGAGTSNVTLGTPPGPFSTPSQNQQITATVTTPAITVPNVTTGVDLENNAYIGLPVAPPAPITVTVTSSGPAIATISSTGTVVGGTTLTFPNVTSANVGTIYIQGKSAGTATLTVSAPGYTAGSNTMTVQPSGFVFYYTGSFSTTTLSAPTGLTVYTASLTPGTLTVSQVALPLNPGLAAINVPVTSSAPAVGTITASPIAFTAGATSATTSFQPVAAGTSNLTVGTPAGFSTPSQYAQITATVTAAPTIVVSPVTTGLNLEVAADVCLPVTPQNAVTVTVTSGGAAIISKSDTVVGGTTLAFAGVTGCAGPIYVQGQSIGSTTLNVSAPGYTSGSGAVSVYPSGFVTYYGENFTTTTFSGPTQLGVYPSILNPGTLTLNQLAVELNPGLASISVPITNSNSSVGTLSANPVLFAANSNSALTNFQPVAAGTTTLSLGTPAGYSTPSQYTQQTATVTAPAIGVNNLETGVNLETTLGISLPVAPPNPVTVTVTSNGPAIATISNSGTVVGGTTLVFTNVTSTFVGTIYVQGQTVGSTTVTINAPGYINGSGIVTVDLGGFAFYFDQDFTTTTSSPPNNLTLYPVSLTPGTLTVVQYGFQVNPGLGAISVPVTSSAPGIGTITTSPVVFNPGDANDSTSFQPVAVGTSTISIGTPAGFSTPSQYGQVTATVQSP